MSPLFSGEIITTNDFEFIEKETGGLDENSLVLFDVDATLIIPNDAILKPKGKNLFKELIAGHTDRDLFREIRMKAPHTLVDSRSLRLVKRLQQNKIPVIAFTAASSKVRGVEQIGMWRVDELKSYGFDFSSAFPGTDVLELPKDVSQQHNPLFKSGVLYCSLHSKGDILILFLQKLDWKPKKVVFIDDELEYVQSVIASLDKQGIPCLGIHYTAANDFPSDLNSELARFQVDHFIKHDVWLSDEESRQLFKIDES